MFKQKIAEDLKKAVEQLGFKSTDIVLSIPENPEFGDYSSNIPLQLTNQKSKKDYHSPKDIANDILQTIDHPVYLSRIEIAGPGFLNFYLKDSELLNLLKTKPSEKTQGQRIIVEYGDPNTHKAFHIGHLLTLTIGESIARLLEFEGNEVLRANYGSDIGLNVAKAIWGIKKLDEEYQQIKKASLQEKAEFLGKAYAYAHAEYEKDAEVKKEIDQLTTALYQRDESLMPLWEETKKWSLGYFDTIYSRTGTEFDRRINESEIDALGKRVVEENIGQVFKKDDGAVIFEGEKHGLHNRVFINSAGNPTYEGKEIGLIEKYQDLFPFDKLIILSDKQQASFHQVVQKAIEFINNSLIGKRHHLSHGFVSLTTGKMSSRQGNVVTADWLIDQVREEIKKSFPSKLDQNSWDKIAIGAIKFYYLKYAVSSDISFDIEKSVSLQGDSGPYVMYAYARTQSILSKVSNFSGLSNLSDLVLEPEERAVLRFLEYFEVIVDKATSELAPNHLTNYLLDLAKAFNLFYEKYPILGSKKEQFRLALTKKVAETLKTGLYLLGIEAVERM